jgi:hypothetical protein
LEEKFERTRPQRGDHCNMRAISFTLVGSRTSVFEDGAKRGSVRQSASDVTSGGVAALDSILDPDTTGVKLVARCGEPVVAG